MSESFSMRKMLRFKVVVAAVIASLIIAYYHYRLDVEVEKNKSLVMQVESANISLKHSRDLNERYEENINGLNEEIGTLKSNKARVDRLLRDANNRVYIKSGGCEEQSNSTPLGDRTSRPFISIESFGRISDTVHTCSEWGSKLNYCIKAYEDVRGTGE